MGGVLAELPILPLKTDALLGDTAHLSAEEFGAYCRILFTMWRHDARLPDSETELARIAGVTLKRWRAIAERVLRPCTIGSGIVSQKRLTETFLNVREMRRKKSEASNIRWLREKGPFRRNADAYPNGILTKTK
jgi:uncharacterized protein YdaU (DUF1376 family)